MQWLFAMHPGVMLLIFAVLAAVLSGGGYALLRMFHHLFGHAGTGIPLAPLFTAITAAWALSLGFAAADVWATNSEAAEAASAERSLVLRLLGSGALAQAHLGDLTANLDAYVEAVREEEWTGRAGMSPSARVEAVLQQMRGTIITAAQSGLPAAIAAKVVRDFDELQDARDKRIALAKGRDNSFKWSLVLLLTVLSHVALCLVHADRVVAGRNALVLFSITTMSCLYVLALHANPYVGVARVEFAL